MIKRGWWKVKIEIDGLDMNFKDLPDDQKEHILGKVKDGYVEGELILEKDCTDMIDGHIIDVYDATEAFIDRYTIVIDRDYDNCFGMSSNPKSPIGFNQYIGAVDMDFFNRTDRLDKIPSELYEAICKRL